MLYSQFFSTDWDRGRENVLNILQAFEILVYKQILEVSRMERITNADELTRRDKEIAEIVEKKKEA